MRVLVECYPDEAVLCALGVPRRQLLHEARKGEVFNWLKKSAGGLGIVDEDPDSAQPRDLVSYQQVQASEGLLLLVRQGSGGQKGSRGKRRLLLEPGSVGPFIGV